MTFVITHRSGSMERDPPFAALDTLVEELDQQDDEHPDISVSHESGWSLSAFPSGRLLRALAMGDLQRLEIGSLAAIQLGSRR